jgi:hypothetical protein
MGLCSLIREPRSSEIGLADRDRPYGETLKRGRIPSASTGIVFWLAFTYVPSYVRDPIGTTPEVARLNAPSRRSSTRSRSRSLGCCRIRCSKSQRAAWTRAWSVRLTRRPGPRLRPNYSTMLQTARSITAGSSQYWRCRVCPPAAGVPAPARRRSGGEPRRAAHAGRCGSSASLGESGGVRYGRLFFPVVLLTRGATLRGSASSGSEPRRMPRGTRPSPPRRCARSGLLAGRSRVP